MYANPIKPVRMGSLEMIVDLLVRRIVISNVVYEMLDYVLNNRMVSIEIYVYVLISVRLMIVITNEVVLALLMGILGISV
jgi:hypothetical protein